MSVLCHPPILQAAKLLRQRMRRQLMKADPHCAVCRCGVQQSHPLAKSFACVDLDGNRLLCVECEHAEAVIGGAA